MGDHLYFADYSSDDDGSTMSELVERYCRTELQKLNNNQSSPPRNGNGNSGRRTDLVEEELTNSPPRTRNVSNSLRSRLDTILSDEDFVDNRKSPSPSPQRPHSRSLSRGYAGSQSGADMHQIETARREAEARVSSILSRSTTPTSFGSLSLSPNSVDHERVTLDKDKDQIRKFLARAEYDLSSLSGKVDDVLLAHKYPNGNHRSTLHNRSYTSTTNTENMSEMEQLRHGIDAVQKQNAKFKAMISEILNTQLRSRDNYISVLQGAISDKDKITSEQDKTIQELQAQVKSLQEDVERWKGRCEHLEKRKTKKRSSANKSTEEQNTSADLPPRSSSPLAQPNGRSKSPVRSRSPLPERSRSPTGSEAGRSPKEEGLRRLLQAKQAAALSGDDRYSQLHTSFNSLKGDINNKIQD